MVGISVIIPSYMPGRYVFDCLDSLMHQTLDISFYEVIIVLNGPKQPYWSMFSSYSSECNNLKMIYSGKPGVSNARNVGIEIAIGEYIAFVDDDDVVSPSYLELLWKAASKDTISMSNIYSFVNSIDEKRNNFFVCTQLKRVLGKKFNNRRLSYYSLRSFLAFPVAKLIHRDIIGNHRFDRRFTNGEDALFITSITDNLSHIQFTSDQAIYYVRERIGSASRKKLKKSKLVMDSLLLIKEYIRIYLSHPWKYDFCLFISRIPGVLKNTFILLKNK